MNPVAYLVKPPQASRRREDHGLFGPGSPTWAVWSHPALLIAGERAAIVQMFHPPTAAGVAQHSVYRGDFRGRVRRTAHYFVTVTLDDGRSAIEASERLRRVHERVAGIVRPPPGGDLAPFAPLLPVLAAATVATIPRHLRRLGGFDQRGVVDAGARPLARMTTAALTLPVLERLLAMLAPEAYAVVHEALDGRTPLRDEVVSPAEARARSAAAPGAA